MFKDDDKCCQTDSQVITGVILPCDYVKKPKKLKMKIISFKYIKRFCSCGNLNKKQNVNIVPNPVVNPTFEFDNKNTKLPPVIDSELNTPAIVKKQPGQRFRCPKNPVTFSQIFSSMCDENVKKNNELKLNACDFVSL